ncbi:hypothetical protein SAMN05216464_11482 [Mucilaginibacter pineti]|uniref:Uncharacterized protein n=1 Tax=Mucilaginibacter pineti TaxID=1391627 RepID=A0A1G7J8M6_9SPHI|nr:hypothetical protein SAMN05216464_11482 [Mucilaginibacter pineti]
MGLIIRVLLFISYILLFLSIFFWFLYHGSGHKIPAATDQSFTYVTGGLTVLCLILLFLKRRFR